MSTNYVNNLALVRDLFQGEEEHQLAIRSVSDEDILTDDFDSGRLLNYHLKQITEKWLSDRFLWLACSEAKKTHERAIIGLLMHVDRHMFINLNRIIVVDDENNIEEACAAINADAEEWPSCIDFDNCNTLGCYWWSQSCVVINMKAINQSLDALQKEYETDGLYFDRCKEEWIGFATTLLHELRHLGLSNPYLDCALYPSDLESESAVEQWALEQFERAG